MIQPTNLLLLMIGVTILLIGALMIWPGLTVTRGGKIFAFVALFILPALAGILGFSVHMERTKQTAFCLSCHIMVPYGHSLFVDDAAHVPAAHFQYARVPREEACYTCHTDYVLYGGVRAKMRGLRHVYIQYFGDTNRTIHLYNPYNNRECLHCHLGARSFEENPVHSADPSIMAAIKSNSLSCLSSGCHETVHDVAHLQQAKFWSPAP
ncbi:MAG: NapC/NirT family cytochrome c [Candidatus Acidiferrales bacterium]